MTRKVIIQLFIILIFFTTCRYKEGPLISFRSVEKRLTGEWQIIEFTSDGVDSLQYYNDSCGSIMTIGGYHYPDGSPTGDPRISFTGGKKEFGGHISFSKNKNLMSVYFGSYSPYILPFKFMGPLESDKTSYWNILKLTLKEFKISTDFNGRKYFISFKKL